MLDLPQVNAVAERCGLSYLHTSDGWAVFVSQVWTDTVEPVMVDLRDDRISEQRLSDAFEAQGIPLAVIEDSLLQTRQNPP